MSASPPTSQSELTSLAGEWRFALDRGNTGSGPAWMRAQVPARIQLPGAVAAQGLGDTVGMHTQWTGDFSPMWGNDPYYRQYQTPENFKIPYWLQPRQHYVGAAWYQREIEIPAAWVGRRITLFLERAHWETMVWLDDALIGRNDRLGVPHEYDLGTQLAPGRHTLTLRVDNRTIINLGALSHSITDYTQGNWNGVIGRIELRATAPAWIEDVRVFPSIKDRAARVAVRIGGEASGAVTAVARYVGPQAFVQEVHATATAAAGAAELTLAFGDAARLWDEFNPHLYELELTFAGARGTDTRRLRFGLREMGRQGARITVNGRPTFLRGTLECAIFPLAGHPPTDQASWRRILEIARAHGLNHLRFHSWCPPEAAFEVGDELGFYYQVECSAWCNQGAEIGSGKPVDAWNEAEAEAIVRAYGNHPSFAFMAYGNEPSGPNHVAWLERFVARWQATDSRRLYTTGSGWPVCAGSDFHSWSTPRIQQWLQGLKSIINSQPPRSDYDWTACLAELPPGPTISHEIGQWCAYPNFEEIAKYTGLFQAKNFEIFRERAERNGLLPYAHDFLMASGKLQALCYKADNEACLRTPGLGGFQLLDLHDFPGQGTALVGVLDVFWESKGYITAEEYRRFSGPVVPLARLPRMIFTGGETFTAAIELAQFGPRDLTGPALWRIHDSAGRNLAEGRLAEGATLRTGELIKLGEIAFPLTDGPARKLTLEVRIADTDAINSWEFWVYPARIETMAPADVVVVHELDAAAEARLRAGGRVLWLPPARQIKGDPQYGAVKMGFSSIFWNTAWTDGQPPHTLGIFCDPRHPALADFPTEYHSNFQWWDLVREGAPFILTAQRELNPIVQVIDDWVTARKLGLIFEARVGAGRLIACAADLTSQLDQRPVARQMRASLLRYMAGPDFMPQTGMTLAELRALVRPLTAADRLGVTVDTAVSLPGCPVGNLLDDDPATLWQSSWMVTQTPHHPYKLSLAFARPLTVRAVQLLPRQDGKTIGLPRTVTLRLWECADSKTPVEKSAEFVRDAAAKTIRLDQPVTAVAAELEIDSGFDGDPHASLAGLSLDAEPSPDPVAASPR
ncbi:MAG: hypothetical protein HZA31_04890 [Opitutae bacterium]|nr:hypothetical protein [Opitutae bacterium]